MLGAFPAPGRGVADGAFLPLAASSPSFARIPVWREGFITDNGNHIIDVHELNISNPPELETRLNQIPGILTVGIFAVRPADILLIAHDSGRSGNAYLIPPRQALNI